MQFRSNSVFIWLLVLLTAPGWSVLLDSSDLLHAQTVTAQSSQIVIDDFESYGNGALPVKWKAQLNGKLVPLTEQFVDDNEWFYAKQEGRRKFVRAYANGEAVHVSKENGDGYSWDLKTHPLLAWDWRAEHLPEGAREDKDDRNDSGAAVYVIFSVDGFILKRPKSIKYVYSSTLPVGTVVNYGKLQVIVASSALDGTGQWLSVERDVEADYRRVFNEKPPSKPILIRLWADSDNTRSKATADFDNIKVLER